VAVVIVTKFNLILVFSNFNFCHCLLKHGWLPVIYLVVFIQFPFTCSAVVLTCFKGDCQSQWKTPIFGPSQLRNDLTDFDKSWNRWLRRRRDLSCQIWFLYV